MSLIMNLLLHASKRVLGAFDENGCKCHTVYFPDKRHSYLSPRLNQGKRTATHIFLHQLKAFDIRLEQLSNHKNRFQYESVFTATMM